MKTSSLAMTILYTTHNGYMLFYLDLLWILCKTRLLVIKPLLTRVAIDKSWKCSHLQSVLKKFQTLHNFFNCDVCRALDETKKSDLHTYQMEILFRKVYDVERVSHTGSASSWPSCCILKIRSPVLEIVAVV